MGGDPIPGPLDRLRERSFSYYREMEALMKVYDLDVPIRVAVIDSGSKRVEIRTGSELNGVKPVFPVLTPSRY